ncbi:MAG: hypothetical protein PWQ57_3319 [Desulfovibrionales bacterium]|nr:hypothetical protein [Desulfovibrionales bacterium]
MSGVITLNGSLWIPSRDMPEHRWPNHLAIVGTAPGWRKDAKAIPENAHVMAVNRAGCLLVDRFVDFWVTLHPEVMESENWLDARKTGLSGAETPTPIVISAFRRPCVRRVLDFRPHCGTTALYAVFVALYLGYRDIGLYGVRLEGDVYGEPRIHDCWKARREALAPYITCAAGGFPRRLFFEED